MVKKIEDVFIRFDKMHERDGHTDRQTHRHTPHDSIAFDKVLLNGLYLKLIEMALYSGLRCAVV